MICNESDVVGLTIAEYLPFDAQSMHHLFSNINLINE